MKQTELNPIKTLGVCYYPEHWPKEQWKKDAEKMAALGLNMVRIGEFAWSRFEPKRGDYQFGWLEDAINILHQAGLKIVLGTPTATPPKWLVDEMPDMLPIGKDGAVRNFGSRRHYSFSHEGYKKECARIVTKLAKRFGQHPGVIAWQTDNEYDCHDTTLSYSEVDLAGFREWLAQKYQSPSALNEAWGNVFWSMEINEFDEIELPNQTVTEANPSHWMDFRRFSSDQVVKFNKVQCKIINEYSPGRDIIHNFMGRTLTFDHFDVGDDLDISSWDSYPLGFLEDRSDRSEAFKKDYYRAGDPDFQAFHHDLYRATSGGRWWVMEQQPGPVNWAPHNPAPRDGMVRLWTLEAFAHGAETVSYFRWRQAPFAQEQMHSGLLRSNCDEAEGYQEAAAAYQDLQQIEWPQTYDAKVAILFDYPSSWAWEIQPQGKEFDYFRLVYCFYKSLRSLGLSIDFVSSKSTNLNEYELLIVPGLFAFNDDLKRALEDFKGISLIGPRSGSKTHDFAIPEQLPPALPSSVMDIKIERVESLRPDTPIKVGDGNFQYWRELAALSGDAKKVMETDDGHPGLVKQQNHHYLCGWPDEELLHKLLPGLCTQAGIPVLALPDGIRCVQNNGQYFISNYSNASVDLKPLIPGNVIFGNDVIEPSGFSIFKAKT